MNELTTACGEKLYREVWPEIGGWASPSSLVVSYWANVSAGNCFDADTMRFFGSSISGLRIAPHTRGSITVELRRKAPSDDRKYGVVLWNRDTEPLSLCSHASRREANACAKATFATIPTECW